MSHPNAPLTPEGRRRLCERVDAGRPISHVAVEAGVSRQTLGKWHERWSVEDEQEHHGEELAALASSKANAPAEAVVGWLERFGYVASAPEEIAQPEAADHRASVWTG